MSEKFENDFSGDLDQSSNTSQPNGPTEANDPSQAGEVIAEAAPPKRFSRRTRLIAIGSAVLLLGGGSAWGYSAYQSPSTVVGMAIGSLFGQPNPAYDITLKAASEQLLRGDAKAAIKVSSGDLGADVNAVIDLNLSGQKFGANIDVVSAKSGDVYVQLSKFDSLLTLISSGGYLPTASANALATAVDGKWVKLSKAEIEQLTSSYGSATNCIQKKYQDQTHADEVKNEMIDLAKAHQFMVVSKELGVKDGSVGYQMKVDAPQMRAFLTGFLDTKAFADIKDCHAFGSSASYSKADAVKAIDTIKDADVQKAMKDITIELWADQWSHNLTNFTVASKSEGLDLSAELKPAGDRRSLVIIPTETISVTDLQNALVGAALAQ